MTRQEAIQAMLEGNKVTHVYFSDNEWMELTATGMYQFEDGVVCPTLLFWMDRKHDSWNEGWDIYKPPNEQNPERSVATKMP